MIKTSRLQSIYEDIFYFFGESSARRCFRNQSKALKALNQLASPADRLNSLLFSEWDPTNVMPRKVFLLHFRESHPIHQYRKKSGNYREKFMGPQGAGARSRPLIINKFWMRRQVGRNITSRRAVSPSGQTRLSCENLSPLKRRSERGDSRRRFEGSRGTTHLTLRLLPKVHRSPHDWCPSASQKKF